MADFSFQNKTVVILIKDAILGGAERQALGLADLVTSPTFSLQAIYSDNIFHYDVYNKTLGEFISLGMLEEFEKNGVHFVEWGDEKLEILLNDYGYRVILIEIEKKDNKRLYKINA